MGIELWLFPAGFVIASLVMAVGIGGGILWTPLLILAYGASPQEAVATSLMIQSVGLGSGALAYFRARLVEGKLALTLFAVAVPGVVLGSLISVQLPQDVVQLALGAMAMTLALVFVSGHDPAEAAGQNGYDRSQLPRVLPIPAFWGVAMGFLSVGVSEWLIPSLRSRLKLKMNRAVGTAVCVMFLLALVAAFAHSAMVHDVHWNWVMWGALGALVGGQLGPLVAVKVNERLLDETFVYLMTLVGIHLIFQAL